MATEQGIVIRTGTREAWVKTVKSGSCEGCTARGACHSLSDGGQREVNAVNEVGAEVGDRIVLSFETSSLLKATFLIYVFPILFLVIGAALGQVTAPYFNFNASGFSAVVGFSFFFAAVFVIKIKANKLAQKNEYRPKIVKVLPN